MTNKDIVEYVQNTPYNTNPVILQQMLKEQDSSEEQYDLVVEYTGRLGYGARGYSKDEIKPIPQEKFVQIFQKMQEGIAPKILFKVNYALGSPAYFMSIPLSVSYSSIDEYADCYGMIHFNDEGSVHQIIRLNIRENGILYDIDVTQLNI